MRLAARDLVAGDDRVETPARQGLDTASASGRYDMVTSAVGTPASLHAGSSSTAPGRHVDAVGSHLRDHLGDQLVDHSPGLGEPHPLA